MADYAPPDRPALDDWLGQAPPPEPPPKSMSSSLSDALSPYLGDRLTGAHGAERYQLWPERAVRGIAEAVHSGVTAPRDALTGNLQVNDPETGMPTREAVKRGGDLASILMGGGMPAAEKGAAGIFGGRLAQTADHAALQRATDMTAAGHAPEAIWKETGWFQGPDKKWRFEIPDNAAQVTPRPAGSWSETVQHPEFYKAYPEAANYSAKAEYGPAGGLYRPSSNTMAVSGPDQAELAASAVHEMQHSVQAREGFEQGAHPANIGLSDGQVRKIAKNVLPEFDSLPRAEQKSLADQVRYIIYKQHAGEVEARNVEARRTMSSEERLANPPWATQDTPIGNQIVKGGKAPSDVFAKAQPPEEHPDWINTRLVTSKKAEPTKDIQTVGLDAMKQSPEAYEHNIGLTKEYPNMPANMANASTDKAAEHFIEHNKNNLLWLHDQVPADIRNRSSMWYEGGRKIIDDWSKEYGLKDSHVAGALAALSPQKDWYQNVSLAKRVIETNLRKSDVTMTPQMEQQFLKRASLNKTEYQPLMGMIRGKSLNDIGKINLPDDEKAVLKALWTRLYDESHNSSAFPIVTPEGGFGANVKTGKGNDAGVGWGSLTEISKAIRSIEGNGSKETQSALMGNKHKVRNFYNNLLAPNSKRGDVTIDTHAVAAGQLRPLSGTSPEVAHNFSNSLERKHQPPGWRGSKGSAVNGVHGTYPLYAEAYRRAAKERGLLPRQMQSITWEAVRGLFPENMKGKKFSDTIGALWNDYRNGKVSLDETRRRVLSAAGGIRLPTWAGPAS